MFKFIKNLFKKTLHPVLNYEKRVCYFDENHSSGRGILIVEVTPHKRIVYVNGRPTYVYFPYSYFIISFLKDEIEVLISKKKKKKKKQYQIKERFFVERSLKVGFSSKPVTNSSSFRSIRAISNNNDGAFGVCLGSCEGEFDSLSDMVAHLMDAYWRNSFDQIDYDFLKLAKSPTPEKYIEKHLTYVRDRSVPQVELNEPLQNCPVVL